MSESKMKPRLLQAEELTDLSNYINIIPEQEQ